MATHGQANILCEQSRHLDIQQCECFGKTSLKEYMFGPKYHNNGKIKRFS